jgi:tripartite ATP-independent transporter DctM subunit
MCRINPDLGPPTARVPWRDRMSSLVRVIDVMALIIFVIGGLFIGWFTPTEAASVGCVAALLLCWWRGKISRAAIAGALATTLRTTGMIYLVVIGALLFATFISVTGVATSLAHLVAALHASPTIAIIAMAAVLLVLGSFLDGIALMLLTTPIFLPIVNELGMSPIWFGIFLVRTMEIGFVHPPMGLNVYVIQGLASDIPLSTIFRGIVPFLVVDFLHLSLLIAFPVLSLWLPGHLG